MPEFSVNRIFFFKNKNMLGLITVFLMKWQIKSMIPKVFSNDQTVTLTPLLTLSTAVSPYGVRHPLSESSCSGGWWERSALMMGCDSRSLSMAEVSTHIHVAVTHTRAQFRCTSRQLSGDGCLCACSYLCVFVVWVSARASLNAG